MAGRTLFLVLAVLAMGVPMGKCDSRWELITADGETLDLSGLGIGVMIGSGSDALGYDGMGLPPVAHVAQAVYQQVGDTLRAITVKARPVTLSISAWSPDKTKRDFHRVRSRLINSLRWDRTESLEPSTLRYTLDGVSADLRVHYAGDVGRRSREGRSEVLGIRLVAHDPLFYSSEERWAALGLSEGFTTDHIVGKIDGIWSEMGPPAPGGNVGAIAIHPVTGDWYIGGGFLNWDGIAAADYIVMWDVSAQAYVAVGGGLNGAVEDLVFGPDNILYLAGAFTDAGGDANADYFCQYDGVSFSAVGQPLQGAAAITSAYAIAIAPNYDIYIGGDFLNWANVAAADYLAMWDYSAGAYVAVGAGGGTGAVHCLELAPNGDLYVGGNFLNWAADADADYVFMWDGANVVPLSTGTTGQVNDLLYATNGILYLAGNFGSAGGDGDIDYIAQWNGSKFSLVGEPGDAVAECLALVEFDGYIYVGCASAIDGWWGMARWSGSAWYPPTIEGDAFGPLVVVYALAKDFGETTLAIGMSGGGTGGCAADVTVTNQGNVKAYPKILLYNQGDVRSLENATGGDELVFADFLMADGEVVTVDFSPGVKTVESSWRGNLLYKLAAISDLTSFGLESVPFAADGDNHIESFVVDITPRESGDNNNQLSGWEDVTGVTTRNTADGYMYVSIVALGGGFYRIQLYNDPARGAADLVGHTAGYNAIGDKIVLEDNGSGLGGTVTVDAVVAADANITVIFTLIEMTWYDQYWDLDSAVHMPLALVGE